MINPTLEIINGSYVKDYEALAREVAQNPEEFWGKTAQELGWYKTWDKVLDWQYPYAHWFTGGQCNIVHNALDRHLVTPIKDKVALIWEGQNGLVRTYTYSQLNDEVSRFANGLKSIGVKRRSCLHLPSPHPRTKYCDACLCENRSRTLSRIFRFFLLKP